MITLAPHLVDIGYGFAFSANILALTMASLAVGKLVLGELLDRLGLKGAISISIMGSVFAYIGLFNAQHKLLLILVILGTGIGCAYGTMVDPYLTRSIFGEKDYSSIYGILAAAASLGGMLSPIVSGLSYDINGNYQNLLFQMGLLALALLLAAQWIFSHKNMQAVKEKWDLD
ncbi:MAG TPA: MFS transporter [Clostridia bacterium]|nr:MFS transporter [Clostridia bacterium]